MAKSVMEQLRSGMAVDIPLLSDGAGYSITVTENAVTVNGCDCASSADEAEVRSIHDALGAWLRIRKSNQKRESTRPSRGLG